MELTSCETDVVKLIRMIRERGWGTLTLTIKKGKLKVEEAKSWVEDSEGQLGIFKEGVN